MIRNKQSGQALVGAAIAMVVLAGFTGLAIDMGALRYERRVEQIAADAAAIAGAQNLNWGSGVTAGAQYASQLNGFTDNNSGAGCVGGSIGCISVAVNNGPTQGPHTGDTKYVEAIVTVIQPTYFMNVFGVGSKPVAARAVATNVSGGTNSSCLYTLGLPTSAVIGIDPTGKAKLIAPNCGISDNGNLDTTGNSYTVEGNTISVSGGCLGSHCGYPDVTCTASAGGNCGTLGGSPVSQDPLKGLAAPTMPAYSTSCPAIPPAGFCDYKALAGTTPTIQPGTYNSIYIGSNASVTMAPGIYYFNGPITLAGLTSYTPAGISFFGKGTLTDMADPGVMLYFTNGSTFDARGGGNVPDVQLTPMTTAENSTYAGITIFQDPSDTTPMYLGGDNNSTYLGAVYMPTAQLNFFGNNKTTFSGTVIAYSVQITGNPTVIFGTSPSGVPVPALLTQPILVE